MKGLNLKTAKELLFNHMQNQNLRRHCVAVGKALLAYFNYYSQNNIDTGGLTAEQWEIAGLLHDADYEQTKDFEQKHTLVLIDWLKDFNNVPQELIDVFKTHNNKVTHLKNPQTLLEYTLECCDELTGFIVAVALVMPQKKLADVTVERVSSKFKNKDFAKQVDRNQILQCKEKLNVEPQDFVKVTLKAMQENSVELGL